MKKSEEEFINQSATFQEMRSNLMNIWFHGSNDEIGHICAVIETIFNKVQKRNRSVDHPQLPDNIVIFPLKGKLRG